MKQTERMVFPKLRKKICRELKQQNTIQTKVVYVQIQNQVKIKDICQLINKKSKYFQSKRHVVIFYIKNSSQVLTPYKILYQINYYDAKQLLSHQWIFKQVQTPDIKQQVQLDVAQNLKDFKNTTVFQGGILSFIVGLKASSEELEELKNLFLRLDTSRDGTLSIDEIQAGMQQMMGILGSQKVNEYQDLMRTLDKDGNGVIDYTEFITGAIDKAALLNVKNLQDAFQMIDQDNSGMITIDELKAVFDTGGDKKDETLWTQIMQEVDKNGDNQISFEEFSEVMTEFLKKKHMN